MKLATTLAAVLVFCCFAAQATDRLRAKSMESDQPGLTVSSAVEVCDEEGAKQYLARLICPGGQHPDFRKKRNADWRNPPPKDMSKEDAYRFFISSISRGPLAPGQPDYHITTEYRVRCDKEKVAIHLDTYHCAQPVPTVAPTGFSIIN